MSEFQTFLKDCDCTHGGIIVYEGAAVCRWCRKPYAHGGLMQYKPEHFQSKEKDIPKDKDWEILTRQNVYAVPEGGTIMSVKRLSDGEVFTLGDYIKDHKTPIDDFILNHTSLGLWLSTNIKNGYGTIIERAEKVKPKIPLFYTLKGEPMYYMEKYWIVTDYFDIDWFCAKKQMSGHNPKNKYFSSEQEAIDFVTTNKHVSLTYNELDQILSDQFFSCHLQIEVIKRISAGLKDFFKSKIKL